MQPIDILRSSPLFAGVDSTTLGKMARALVLERWPKHAEIMPESQTNQRFVVLVRGRVKVVRSNGDNGRDLTLWLLGPGDGFDIIGLLDALPHAVSVWTLDEVEALSGPIALFQGWLERYAPFRLAVHRYVARQLRALSELACDLALHDTMCRLARLLLRHLGGSGDRHANLLRGLPHEELAAMIGSVRVVVNRLLSQLKREAVVRLDGGSVNVLDLERLLRRAESEVGKAATARQRGRRQDPSDASTL